MEGLYCNWHRRYNSGTGAYISQDPIRLEAGLTNLYAYVKDVNRFVDVLGLNEVLHFVNFDEALRKAFEIAKDGVDDVIFTPVKIDPMTGTEVEFIGSNGSKIAFDPPHPDRTPELGHDKPHIGVQNGGKRGNGGAKRYNLTYDGEQHPFRSPYKDEGLISQCI